MKVNLNKFFKENSTEKLVELNSKLIYTKYKIYGVKIPVLRNEAKKLYLQGLSYKEINVDSLEEIILKGLLLSFEDVDEILNGLEKLLPYFDNWCSVDVIVPSLKKLKGNERAFEFFKNCCQSQDEFVCRTGIIGLMKFFVDDFYIEITAEIISKIDSEKYYIQMACAWAFCEFFIKNFTKTLKFYKKVTNSNFKKFCAQKCRDSFRLSQEQKEEITKLSKN